MFRKAEELVLFAYVSTWHIGQGKIKPGETYLRWKAKEKKCRPELFRAEHFNHRLI